MTYATRDDLVTAYGQDMVDRLSIRMEDPDGSQTVARALNYSDGLIDAQLSVKFVLPLPVVPQLLVDVAVDLAIGRMADSPDIATDEIRRREERARADLKAMADGRMNLGLPAKGPSDSPQPVLARIQGGGDRLFTREDLRGL